MTFPTPTPAQPEPSAPIRGITEKWDRTLVNEIDEKLRPTFVNLNRHIRLRTGFAPERNSRNQKLVAEYRDGAFTTDGDPAIFISPLWDDPVTIAVAIEREMIRSAYVQVGVTVGGARVQGLTNKYGFQSSCQRQGIRDGFKLDETPVFTDAKRLEVEKMLDPLGPRPHGKMTINERAVPKQSTNLLRGECRHCRLPVRVTETVLRRAWPACIGNGNHPVTYVDVAMGTAEVGMSPVPITHYIPATRVNATTHEPI